MFQPNRPSILRASAVAFIISLVVFTLIFTRFRNNEIASFSPQEIIVEVKETGLSDMKEFSPLEQTNDFVPDGRPAPSQRLFNCSALEKLIVQIRTKIKDPIIGQIFANCLPNTLDTTVYYHDTVQDSSSGLTLPYTYIVTGDIGAMWLRDSAYQVTPYMQIAKQDKKLQTLILGIINTQAEMIELYPFANAYFPLKHWNSSLVLNQSIYTKDDIVFPTYKKDEVFEAKYELDSLAAFLHITNEYTQGTGDVSYLDNPHWVSALNTTVKTLRSLQAGTQEFVQKNQATQPYTFTRPTRTQSETSDLYGLGNPVKRCGLIRSFFRPSDDSTIFQYLIPSNAIIAVVLDEVVEILHKNSRFTDLMNEMKDLSKEVREAIKKFGIVQHPEFGSVYAFEVDCFGSHAFMDDANFPSLLSLPYFNFVDKNDPIYLNTRKYILSPDWNPYFAAGKFPGVGSPHTGLQTVWPVAHILQAMTSTNETEIKLMLMLLRNTTANTGFMHESYNVDNPSIYTRSWFAWANSMFGNLILYLEKNYPHILAEDINI